MKFSDIEDTWNVIWDNNVVKSYEQVQQGLKLQSEIPLIKLYLEGRMKDYCLTVLNMVNEIKSSMFKYEDKDRAQAYLVSTINQAKPDLNEFKKVNISEQTKATIEETLMQLEGIERLYNRSNIKMPEVYQHEAIAYTSLPTNKVTTYNGTLFGDIAEYTKDEDFMPSYGNN